MTDIRITVTDDTNPSEFWEAIAATLGAGNAEYAAAPYIHASVPADSMEQLRGLLDEDDRCIEYSGGGDDFAVGDRVCGGKPGTEDYDEGRVVASWCDGQVTVGWQSGVATTVDPSTLRPGHEGAFLDRDGTEADRAAAMSPAEVGERYMRGREPVDGVTADQDWENGTTKFTFSDGSSVIVDDVSVTAVPADDD